MNTLLLIPPIEGNSTTLPFCEEYSCLATDIFNIEYFSDIPEEPIGALLLFAKTQFQGTMTYYSYEGFQQWSGALDGETLVAGYGVEGNQTNDIPPVLQSTDMNREFCHPGLGCTGFGNGTGIELPVGEFVTIFIPEGVEVFDDTNLFYPHTSGSYWDGETISSSFSVESSVGQIFINDNLDSNFKEDCQIEFNMGNITGKSLYDSSGHANQGLLMGDYKIKKTNKESPVTRDSFIKIPKKDSKEGAL